MVGENESRRWLVILMWGLATIPPLLAVLTELNKTHLVWYMRVVDFFDLIVLAPFYLASFLALHGLIVYHERRFAYWLGFVLIGAFMYGHAMHLTANAIDTYSFEIQDYKSIIPADSYALLHFFDENLGHWLLFGAYFALLGTWLWEDRFTGISWLHTVLPGMLLGAALAIAVVEGSHPWLGAVAVGLVLGLAFLRSRREHCSIVDLWKIHPVARFVIAAALAMAVAELLYWIVMGGFVQPSELGY